MQSLAQHNLRVFYFTSFRSLTRQLSDIYDVKRLAKSIQKPYMLTWDRDLVPTKNTSYNVLKCDVNLDENKYNIPLKITVFF